MNKINILYVFIAGLLLLCIIAVAEVRAESALVFNASGTFIRVPEVNYVNMTCASILPYMTSPNSLTVNVTALTASSCQLNLTIYHPNGTLLTTLSGSIQPLTSTSFTVDITTNTEYIVLGGDICNISIPYIAVSYKAPLISVPQTLDERVKVLWSLFIYAPLIGYGLRSNPRIAGIAIIATTPLMYLFLQLLGVDPGISYVSIATIFVMAVFMAVIRS